MQQHSGFSLLELMVTIGVISIMAAIAVPGIIRWLPRYHLGNAARDVLSVIESARVEAVKRNTSIGVNFNTGSNRYSMWIDNGVGGGSSHDATQNGAESTIFSGQMPAGINMASAAFGSNQRFRFNGMGIPMRTDGLPGGGSVTLTNNNGDTRMVIVKRGGNSSIQ